MSDMYFSANLGTCSIDVKIYPINDYEVDAGEQLMWDFEIDSPMGQYNGRTGPYYSAREAVAAAQVEYMRVLALLERAVTAAKRRAEQEFSNLWPDLETEG